MSQTSLDQKWTQQITRTGVGQSLPVKIPAYVNEITVSLIPNGNTAEVQATASDESAIDGATANWIPWDPGVVTSNTMRAAVGPITGLRINQTVGAGTSTLEIAAQRDLP